MSEMTEQERIAEFNGIVGDSIPQDLKQALVEFGFFTAPASAMYHGSYEGGLYDHSKNVTLALLGLTRSLELKWGRPQSPFIVGMLHDLCKIDNYIKVDTGVYDYNKESMYRGHGDKSVMMIANFMTLTEEELLCIRYHMGAFTDKDEWGYYTRAIHTYPNVLYTHTADMIAAHIMEVN